MVGDGVVGGGDERVGEEIPAGLREEQVHRALDDAADRLIPSMCRIDDTRKRMEGREDQRQPELTKEPSFTRRADDRVSSAAAMTAGRSASQVNQDDCSVARGDREGDVDVPAQPLLNREDDREDNGAG
jgi:hypothetical protein